MIKLVIPKGSLEEQTIMLLRDADIPVRRYSDREYSARIDDDRISQVAILRPQEIGKYVEEGLFDLGITGLDWIRETGADVEILADFPYAKTGAGRNLRIVLAVRRDSGVKRTMDLPEGTKVATEYPNIAQSYFEGLGINARIIPSAGATEAKVPDIVDAIVEITETGSTLRAHGLEIIDDVLHTSTRLIANRESYADQSKRKVIDEIKMLLMSTIAARGKVLLKMNVSKAQESAVLDALPALESPTVSHLANGDSAIETVVEKSTLAGLIPRLKENGATGILEIPLGKVIP
ncbi:MAG: ATP phosphoribosyltransferase [Candidatus Anoxymicrobium japonicum]|uniref:ATP phosphoribosyltransferase n=1 Tax=Candidatus Anoxymicrobium japonicum TaxID=2013648 RepID=A0A2N3G6Y3_9ACTN|nr:MAG: ATP phosphoribosyltransferase [Candidatus Anoxymicrobium japonicum]